MRGFSALALFIMLYLTCQAATAQRLQDDTTERPDFSGTWQLNRGKSSEQYSRNTAFPDFLIVIEQKLPSVRFKEIVTVVGKERQSEFTLFTDGRGDSYAGELLPLGRSKTSWQDDALLATVNDKSTGQTGFIKVDMSADRNALTISWAVTEATGKEDRNFVVLNRIKP